MPEFHGVFDSDFRLFMSELDSPYARIVATNNLRGNLVRVKFSPRGGRYADANAYDLRTLSSEVPTWFNDQARAECRAAFRAWLDGKIVNGYLAHPRGQLIIAPRGATVCGAEYCHIIACDNADINASTCCFVEAYNESSIVADNYALIVAHDRAQVRAYNDVVIYSYDDAHVVAHHNVRVYVLDKGQVDKQDPRVVVIRVQK